MTETKKLQVFLCHASADKPKVRELYRYLRRRGIAPWLDAEDLLPGQDWQVEIPKALLASDVIIVCLTKNSVTREGYVQKEIGFALDKALEKPGAIFIIPAKLEECDVPDRLSRFHWVDLHVEGGYLRLMRSLKLRAEQLARASVEVVNPTAQDEIGEVERQKTESENKGLKEAKVVGEYSNKKNELKESLSTSSLIVIPRVEKQYPALEGMFSRLNTIFSASLKILVSMLFGGFTALIGMVPILRRQFGLSIPSNVSGLLIMLSMVVGIVLGATFLRKRSWGFLIAFGGSALILLFVLIVVTNPVSLAAPALTQTFAPQTTKTLLPSTFTPAPPTDIPFTPTPSLTPTLAAGATQISSIDGMVLHYVPAGPFMMGSDTDEADERPAHTVTLDTFWIDESEVTNQIYARCVKDSKCQPPSNQDSRTHKPYYGNPQFADYPVIYISWSNAAAYCAWAGRALPSEAQWEKAARGPGGNIYPWGNDAPNYTLLNYFQNVGDTSRVGTYPNGMSFYGVYDMAGNVWEWVNDWYHPAYYATSPSANPVGPSGGQNRVLRGGAWSFYNHYVHSADRYNYPVLRSSDIGFRCALTP